MELTTIRDWLAFVAEIVIAVYVIAEYYYDKEKDEVKKQKRTRTIKKAVTSPTGDITTEEITETTESKGDSNAQ
jgi:uncharacterized membrane protein